ncbi:MAG: hypothetical protein Q8N26_37250 [Myxococcales bacterium]|nr:hypothetical protein [Myxococcales bacterium]
MKMMIPAAAAALALSGLACSPPTPAPDGGTAGGSAGGSATGGGSAGGSTTVTYRSFTAPSTTPVSGSFLFTITGEESASEGFSFPPPAGSTEPSFIDGWEVRYEHMLTTVDNITLSTNPDMTPGNPGMTGPAVARATGPWAVDLAKEGPVVAKEMEGKAFPLVRLSNQTLATGTPAFGASTKYAFSFDLVEADANPIDVNLDADAKAAYQVMRTNGWSYWVKGTATWKGDMGTPACRSTNASYDFGRLPKVVNFSFGWKVPASYKNCLNQELMPADSRGVQLGANGAEATVQVTLHNDHPFWDALEEDAPLRFDAVAARKSVAMGMAPAATLTNADLTGVDFQAVKDAQGTAVPFRYCGAVQMGERTMGGLTLDPKGVPVNPAGGAGGLKDLYEYMAYNLSTLAHANAGEGLCVVERKYPSPQ